MATKQTASPKAKRPVHEIRLGRIVAAIWEQNTQYGVRHNVSVSRIYRDDEGKWLRTQGFGRDDLLIVSKALDLAHTWVCEQSKNSTEARTEEESDEEVPY